MSEILRSLGRTIFAFIILLFLLFFINRDIFNMISEQFSQIFPLFLVLIIVGLFLSIIRRLKL